MEAKRFDALARKTTRAPRRSVLAGLLAASVGRVLGTRGVAAAPGDYDSRGQRCTATTCNSPCRRCDDSGRCVYACQSTDVCNASALGCDYQLADGSTVHIEKGCCVPRA